MNRRTVSALSAVMYFVCFIATVCLIGADFTLIKASHFVKFITAFIIFPFGYSATFLRCKMSQNRAYRYRITKQTLLLLFFVYLMVVIDFTLIDDSFGREVSNIFTRNKAEIAQYINNNINIIPFATIRLYLNALFKGYVAPMIVAENLVGNLLVFMPFAFFVPIFFKTVNNAMRFLVAIFATVLVIEFLQLVFLTGSSDIDDVLLNVGGAMLAFAFLRYKKITPKIHRLTFKVWPYKE